MPSRSNWMRLVSLLALLGAPAAFSQESTLVAERIGVGLSRYYASPEARSRALPSFALVARRQAMVGETAPAELQPVYSQRDGRTVVTVSIPEGTSLYGTGMVGGPLLRNGRVVEAWNTDAYGYGEDTKSLYQSHPWVLAVRPDGTSFGVLADTTYRCTIDLTEQIVFEADGPEFATIVIEGDTPQDVVKRLADLTGKIDLPPRWALGYHQCRYSYYPQQRVIDIAVEFRQRRIPCDVIWLDIDYMDGYRVFTFDPIRFPSPRQLGETLHRGGFAVVWMIDPGVKAERGYFVYDQLMAGDHAVRRSDGTVYTGDVWPGACVFPDFLRRETREWWAGLYPPFVKAALMDGIWNDMNEPAIFNVPSKTMPLDNLHRPDPDLLGHEGADASHARFHNVYGMMMARATREGFRRAEPGKRPFVLTRANYIGGQRFAATWTGDNIADWTHLEMSIPMVLNLGLSGQPFSGPDIGGFVGDGDGELFARWMGIGAMLPFARGHTGKENINKEPWAFGPDVEHTCRQALERRYRLIPYLYTTFRNTSIDGMPVCRPVFFADPTDPALRSEDDAFLLGEDILVVAKVTPDRSRVPLLPKGNWRRFDFSDADNPDLPELYLRPGAIVPTGPVIQKTEDPIDPITLLVCLDENGLARGDYYMDLGDGFAHRDGDAYRINTYTARSDGQSVAINVERTGGILPQVGRTMIVRLLLPDREIVAEGKDGEALVINLK